VYNKKGKRGRVGDTFKRFWSKKLVGLKKKKKKARLKKRDFPRSPKQKKNLRSKKTRRKKKYRGAQSPKKRRGRKDKGQNMGERGGCGEVQPATVVMRGETNRVSKS